LTRRVTVAVTGPAAPAGRSGSRLTVITGAFGEGARLKDPHFCAPDIPWDEAGNPSLSRPLGARSRIP
jgi:hypothetical protein